MQPSNFQARRATVDDLVVLRRLWQYAGMPVATLERQWKDVQVVETPDGNLLASLALKIDQQQAMIHSEVYTDAAPMEELRERLWQRAQALARNFGLLRIWVSGDSPEWADEGFGAPPTELLAKLPPSFGDAEQPWLVKIFREELSTSASLERELELFTLAQRESSERLMRQASVIKNVAYVILFLFIILALILVALSVLPSSSWSRMQRNRPAPEQTEPANPR